MEVHIIDWCRFTAQLRTVEVINRCHFAIGDIERSRAQHDWRFCNSPKLATAAKSAASQQRSSKQHIVSAAVKQ